MTALDLSAYVTATTDSDELRAFKEQVKTVAAKYTRTNGWCDEVKKGLKELGIEDERGVQVKVFTTFGPELAVNIMPSILAGKTEEEQKLVVAGTLGSLKIAGAGFRDAYLTMTPALIDRLELFAAPTSISVTTPDGHTHLDTNTHRWLYSSDEGRVLHRFALRLDGRTRSRATCGTYGYDQTLISPRGQNRPCVMCTRITNT